jgi:hypothetical protein
MSDMSDTSDMTDPIKKARGYTFLFIFSEYAALAIVIFFYLYDWNTPRKKTTTEKASRQASRQASKTATGEITTTTPATQNNTLLIVLLSALAIIVILAAVSVFLYRRAKRVATTSLPPFYSNVQDKINDNKRTLETELDRLEQKQTDLMTAAQNGGDNKITTLELAGVEKAIELVESEKRENLQLENEMQYAASQTLIRNDLFPTYNNIIREGRTVQSQALVPYKTPNNEWTKTMLDSRIALNKQSFNLLESLKKQPLLLLEDAKPVKTPKKGSDKVPKAVAGAMVGLVAGFLTTELQETRQRLDKKTAEVNKMIEQLQAENKKLEELKSGAQEQLDLKDENYAELHNSFVENLRERDENRKQLELRNEQIRNLVEETTDLTKHLASVRTLLQETKIQQEQAEGDKDRAENELKQLKEKNNRLTGDLQQVTFAHDQLMKDFIKKSVNLETLNATYEKQTLNILSNKATNGTEVIQLQKICEHRLNELRRLNEKVVEYDSRVSDMQEKHKDEMDTLKKSEKSFRDRAIRAIEESAKSVQEELIAEKIAIAEKLERARDMLTNRKRLQRERLKNLRRTFKAKKQDAIKDQRRLESFFTAQMRSLSKQEQALRRAIARKDVQKLQKEQLGEKVAQLEILEERYKKEAEGAREEIKNLQGLKESASSAARIAEDEKNATTILLEAEKSNRDTAEKEKSAALVLLEEATREIERLKEDLLNTKKNKYEKKIEKGLEIVIEDLGSTNLHREPMDLIETGRKRQRT